MATPQYEFLTHQDMDNYYMEVIRQMSNSGYKPDVIVALSRGGLDFGVKISNWFNDAKLVPLVWQTRDGDDKETDALDKVLSKYNHGNILIVDDILDTGTTLSAIDSAIRTSGSYAVIDFAVAIENQDVSFDVQWAARTISRLEDTQWFVFPWENWWNK